MLLKHEDLSIFIHYPTTHLKYRLCPLFETGCPSVSLLALLSEVFADTPDRYPRKGSRRLYGRDPMLVRLNLGLLDVYHC